MSAWRHPMGRFLTVSTTQETLPCRRTKWQERGPSSKSTLGRSVKAPRLETRTVQKGRRVRSRLRRTRWPAPHGQSKASHLWRVGVATRNARRGRIRGGTSSTSATVASIRHGEANTRSTTERQATMSVRSPRRTEIGRMVEGVMLPRPVRGTVRCRPDRVFRRRGGSSGAARGRRCWSTGSGRAGAG